jgi:AraC-like DNA-binding protein
MESVPTSPPKLPVQFRLDLEIHPGNARQFELFRYGMAPFYAVDAADPRARASFGAEITSYQFADIAIAAGHSSAATFERTKQTIARSGVDNICLLVYSAGGSGLDADGRAVEIRPGDVCIFDMTRPSTVKAPDFTDLSIVLPRALFETNIADPGRLHGQVLERGTALNAMLVSHLQTVYAHAGALSLSDARTAAQVATALVTAFAGASGDGRESLRHAAAATWLQAARRVVEANLHDRRLGPAFLCGRLGMSRTKLYRLFEAEGGVSHYILKRRLTRAYRSLLDAAHAHEGIGAIAAQCGFNNISVFSRAFRQTHGMSPTELRDAFGRGEMVDAAPPLTNDFAAMSRWLSGNTAA